MGFIGFMSSAAGRATRIFAGLVLVGVGLALLASNSLTLGALLIAFGSVFVAVGIFDVCLLAPLFGQPISGSEVRAHLRSHAS